MGQARVEGWSKVVGSYPENHEIIFTFFSTFLFFPFLGLN
jgi:hypothetical protein